MATVYQTFEAVLRAVPTQSLRARSKWESAPGPSEAAAADAAGTAPTIVAGKPIVRAAAAPHPNIQ